MVLPTKANDLDDLNELITEEYEMLLLTMVLPFRTVTASHKELLNQQGWEVSCLRGPLKQSEIIGEVAHYDAHDMAVMMS